MTISTGLAAKPTIPQAIFTDFSSLDSLRASAGREPQSEGDGQEGSQAGGGALEEAARQFSSIFLHMALKSMREASFGGGILDSQQSEFYRDMFDQQIALDLSEGEGFGLTDVIVNQLSQRVEPVAAEVSAVDAAQAYARVADATQAKEPGTPADIEDSGEFSLEPNESRVRSGVTESSRLATP